MRKIFGVLLLACVVAQAENPVPLETKPVVISLFKNGLGFVTREGRFPGKPSLVTLEGLPETIHGTFWIRSDRPFEDLIAFQTERKEMVEANSLSEILMANVGQSVELTVREAEVLRGKILSVPDSRTMDAQFSREGYPQPSQPGTILLLETTEGIVAVNKADVRQIRIVKGDLKTSFEKTSHEPALRMQAGDPEGKFTVHYLTRGITWAPSCEIDISDPNTARVSAKAEILNELEDFNDVSVDFITGFPNFQFADVIDPMAMKGDVSSFLKALMQRGSNAAYRNRNDVVMQQSSMSNVAYTRESLPGYSTAPPEEQTREELFFYQEKNVTLKKGSRGYYPIYSIDVPYQHVYEWKISDMLNQQEQYSGYNQQTIPPPEVVWHSIRLSNTGKSPWTTAPAMIVQGGKILGQDLVYYTSPGSKTLVKITQAVDIQAEKAELELERQRGATKFYGYNYDLVTVRGSLKVVNYKSKDVVLTVSKELSGEVIRSVPQAAIEQTAQGLKRVNSRNVLTWELPIAARGEVEVEYQYRVYVRD